MTFFRFEAVQWIIFAVIVSLLIYLLSPILTPFVAAAILAYICNPIVRKLCSWKLPRAAAVLVVMSGLALAMVSLVLIMVPLLEQEVTRLITRLPQWIESAKVHLLPKLQLWFGADLQWDSEAIKQLMLSHWQSASGLLQKILPWLNNSSGAIISAVSNLLLIPLAMFYLLRDWDEMLDRIEHLLPRSYHQQIVTLAGEIDRILAEFLRGQLAVMLLMSLFYIVALWLTGLEFALPIGILAGLLVFIPYLGTVLGLVLATFAAVMQFGSYSDVLMVWLAFAIGQVLEGFVITPWLVGDRVGLHPLAVIFALLAFGQLFGFFGLLLALPLAAIVLVTLRFGKRWYLNSELYQK